MLEDYHNTYISDLYFFNFKHFFLINQSFINTDLDEACWLREGKEASSGVSLLLLVLIIFLLGREVKHLLCLRGHPVSIKAIKGWGWTHSAPTSELEHEAHEKHGHAHNYLPPIGVPIHLNKALVKLEAVQIDFLIPAQAAPGQSSPSRAFWLADNSLTWATSGRGWSRRSI